MRVHYKISTILGAGLLGATMLAAPALATQGFIPHAYGIKSKGVAGSDIAFAQSAMTVAVNPAGLVDVDDQLTVGVSMFSPNRKYSATVAGAMASSGQTSKNKLFAIPNLGYSRKLSDRVTFGFALYAAGGMNTEYKNTVFMSTIGPVDGKTGIDLSVVNLSPALSFKLNDMVSIGVAPVFTVSRFRAQGLTNSFGVPDRGYNYAFGFGGRVGVQVKPSDMITLAAYYQTRTYMSRFKKYAGLFAEKGDFDMPANLGAGIAFKPIPALTLTGGYKHIWYNKVKAVGNPLVGPAPLLGTKNGSGFGWKGVDVFSVGATYDVNDRFTVRAGYAYNTQPIKGSETMFNILAPATIQHHITGGLSFDISEKVTLDLAGMVAPATSVSGTGAAQALYGVVTPITLKMWQAEASAGITWKF